MSCLKFDVPLETNLERTRSVCIEQSENSVRIKAEVCGFRELMAIAWTSDGSISVQFPVFEVLTFDIETGEAYLQLQNSDAVSLAKYDLMSQPDIWQNGIVHRLIREDVSVSEAVKRAFVHVYGAELPFEDHQLAPNKYIAMTAFIGYPRNFYDEIPYVKGTYRVERTFAQVAKRLRRSDGALALFEQAEIPKSASIKKLFFSNAGLLFYMHECEMLWKAVNDINYYRSLLKSENVFLVLSLLHQRPLVFNLISDYVKVKGVRQMIERLTKYWVYSIDYAMDYCTMNDAMKEEEQDRWRQRVVKRRRYDFEFGHGEDDEDFFLHVCDDISAQFSLPMKMPDESIQDCVIDGFSFECLRCGNDYHFAGTDLKNCLVNWNISSNPVVAVRKAEKIVAAIELDGCAVQQVRGYRNGDIANVANLTEAYRKWCERFSLADFSRFKLGEMPF